MGTNPTFPGGDLRGQQKELDTFQFALNGATPRLGPYRLGAMVIPGHRVFKKRAGIPEDLGSSIDAPIVHETGVAKRSPCD